MINRDNLEPHPLAFVNAEAINAGMVQGYRFAGAFLGACRAIIDQHPGQMQCYQQHGLNRNTRFALLTDENVLFVDTIARFSQIPAHLFGVNRAQFNWLSQPPIPAQCGGHVRQLEQIAILAYAGHRPPNERRVFAQLIPQIRVVHRHGQFVDTALDSFTTLSAVLAHAVGLRQDLANQIEQLTIATAQADPELNPQ